MYRALWGQRHEGDTGISQYDPCTVHHPKYQNHISHVIMGFKHDMTYMVFILNEAEICKQSSEAGDGDSCIVGNMCIILWVTCIATPLWRHSYSDVTKSTQKMDANMRGWEILWKVSFSIILREMSMKLILFQIRILFDLVRNIISVQLQPMQQFAVNKSKLFRQRKEYPNELAGSVYIRQCRGVKSPAENCSCPELDHFCARYVIA